jgi:hypothetical protein
MENFMLGKYSPTVQSVYKQDASWFEKYSDPENRLYDKDGYDQYGYDRNGVDRAGNTMYDYQTAELDADIYYDILMEYAGYDPRKGGM